ncbi:TonB-dependent receptor [Pedobacter punctiformis]|uniref:TonB-dependent receptor n=1 Tax=Pedobacter punctiformis TaxID=3004097 RepID=A0ABT4L3Y3_9SPHI|nr:TonB-dependent receptor [Pedobacter sp. HCMS5-2]MCZ4242629.1 TonB-dependent receptor [Pedobacter sp. HCMS5-2]
MKKIFTPFLSLLALFVVLVTANANAQTKSGIISGTVRTSDGKPAPYISVGIKNTGKAVETDENGTYTFKNLADGNYVIKISAVGVAIQEKKVSITGGKPANADFSVAESASQLDEVAINGYKTPNKKPVNLGKIAIAPIDLPQSVQIIGSQVIADQQVNTLGDVMKNINGVALGANRGSVGENFYSRGYSLGSNNIFKNGVRTTIGGSPEASTLESVEVLKGSSALLYGGVTGGAVVNMVTKKPKFEYGGEVSLRAGSYDYYKPSFDWYGPMSQTAAFRIIGTAENSNSFRDFVSSKRIYVNPSMLFKLSKKTELLVQADYLKSDFTPDFGVGSVGSKIVDYGREKFVNAPWAYNKTNTATGQLNLNHNFNEDWKLNVIASLQSYNRDYFGAERIQANTDGISQRNLTRSRTNEFTYNQQINLNGIFKTWNIKHTLLVGADADQSNVVSSTFYYGKNPNGSLITAFNYGDVNLFKPETYFGSGIMPATSVSQLTTTNVYRMGGFAQDLIELTNQFKVLAGIRWTFQKAPTTDISNLLNGVDTKGTTADKIDKAYSPKFGLIYQPLKTTSFYVSYANNFISNSGVDIYGSALGASIVDQYEAGVKNDFFDGKLSANVTVYRINNSNIAQMALLRADGSTNSDTNVKEFTGKTSSDGVELDITATLVRGLNFIAGYSYNFMRYTETLGITDLFNDKGIKTGQTSGAVTGIRLVGTTKNTANATLFYTLQNGGLKGLKFGASAFYTGDRNGGWNPTKVEEANGVNRLIPLKGFTTFDFSAGYSWSKLSVLAKMSNITNELNYFVHENYSVNPIPPRQVLATLTYKF